MNLSHLNYFVRLADEKHFANTAKTLSIARSTLSLAISQLEKELGAPLFTKNGSTFTLTRYGREFYRYASLALQSVETGKRNVAAMIDNNVEILRVGVPFAMQSEEWSRNIREFRSSTTPKVSVKIMQDTSSSLLRGLAAGTLDVVFAAKLSSAPDGLTFIPIWSQQLTVVVNKDNPLAQRTSISLTELQGVALYSYANGCPPHDEIQKLVDRYHLSIKPAFRDEITICSTISANEDAVAFVDYSFLIKAFGEVKCLRIDEVDPDFHKIYLVHRAGEHLTNAQSRFIAFMQEHPVPPARLPEEEQEEG